MGHGRNGSCILLGCSNGVRLALPHKRPGSKTLLTCNSNSAPRCREWQSPESHWHRIARSRRIQAGSRVLTGALVGGRNRWESLRVSRQPVRCSERCAEASLSQCPLVKREGCAVCSLLGWQGSLDVLELEPWMGHYYRALRHPKIWVY